MAWSPLERVPERAGVGLPIGRARHRLQPLGGFLRAAGIFRGEADVRIGRLLSWPPCSAAAPALAYSLASGLLPSTAVYCSSASV